MTHYVVASYHTPESAAGAVAGLVSRGFAREEIGVITERSAPDATHEAESPLVGTFSALGVPGHDARDLVERIDAGDVVVGVVAPGAVLAATAQAVMQEFEPSTPAEAFVGGTSTEI